MTMFDKGVGELAYEPLPIVDTDLDDVRLDLENYRIPIRPDDEEAALKYLFASEDVIGAARMILRDGYFDNEVPIVFAGGSSEVGAKFTVLEGNRRVSALKALLDPAVAPGHEQELKGLLKRYAVEAENLPRRIRVLVAESRAQAAPHIARLHTGVPKKRWTRDQQANFYYSLLDDQTTVEDIKAQYPSVDVRRFIKMAVMRRMVSAAPFADRSLRNYANSEELKMSSFEYAYRNKDIAAALGATFDSDGFLEPRGTSPERIGRNLSGGQLKALEYLLGELRAGRLNTRSPEFQKKSDEHLVLVARLRGDYIQSDGEPSAGDAWDDGDDPPRPRTRGSSGSGAADSSGSADHDAAGSDGHDASGGNRGPNHPDTKPTLDLSGLRYEGAPVNLKVRYLELRKMDVRKFPIATAILMRSILEATIKVHFENSSSPVTGQLKEVFGQVHNSYGKVKSLKPAIDLVRSGNVHKPGSIQWFNIVAHSADAAPSVDDVRGAWKVVNPLLRHLLQSTAP